MVLLIRILLCSLLELVFKTESPFSISAHWSLCLASVSTLDRSSTAFILLGNVSGVEIILALIALKTSRLLGWENLSFTCRRFNEEIFIVDIVILRKELVVRAQVLVVVVTDIIVQDFPIGRNYVWIIHNRLLF